MRDMAKPRPPRRDQVFFITVAVDAERYVSDCAKALSLLKRAGYVARPLSHEVLRLVAEDPESVPQFREIGESYDPPPEAA
jgi:hypothetical protein